MNGLSLRLGPLRAPPGVRLVASPFLDWCCGLAVKLLLAARGGNTFVAAMISGSLYSSNVILSPSNDNVFKRLWILPP